MFLCIPFFCFPLVLLFSLLQNLGVYAPSIMIIMTNMIKLTETFSQIEQYQLQMDQVMLMWC